MDAIQNKLDDASSITILEDGQGTPSLVTTQSQSDGETQIEEHSRTEDLPIVNREDSTISTRVIETEKNATINSKNHLSNNGSSCKNVGNEINTELNQDEELLQSLSGRPIKEEPVENLENEDASVCNDICDPEPIQHVQDVESKEDNVSTTDSTLPLSGIKSETFVKDYSTPCISSDSVSQPKKSTLVYRCKYCGQQLKTITSLQKHEEAHRKGTIYKCRNCEYYAMERTRIADHERSKHTGEKPFACDLCDFRSASQCDLKKHSKVHSDYRPFACKLCSYCAKTSNHLLKHMQIHSDDRPFSCDLCDKTFKRKSARDNHRLLHLDEFHYFCDKCDYACKTPNMLRQHFITHSQVRKFECTHPGCSQRCKTKSDLVKHMSVHKTGLDYKCVLCSKQFKSIGLLRSHTRRHEKREFPCQICGKILTSNDSRRHHMMNLHLEGKKIVCLICGGRYASKDNLKAHIKVHKTDRCFRCPLCLHGFMDVNHLFTHIGVFHGKDYVYFCEVCNRAFPRYMRMKFHIDRNHITANDKDNVHQFIYNECCVSYNVDEVESKMRTMQRWIKGTDSIKDEVNSDLILEEVKPELEMIVNVNNHSDLNMASSIAEELTSSKNVSAPSSSSSAISLSNECEQQCATQDSGISVTCDNVQTCYPEEQTSVETPFGVNQVENHHECDPGSNSELPPISNSFDLGNKILTVKLERLDCSVISPGKTSVMYDTSSIMKSPENFSKVIQLGSYANINIKLVGRDSGIKFRMKKGTKCKGWFAQPDNLMPEARKKTMKYLAKNSGVIPTRKASKRPNTKKGRISKASVDQVLKTVSQKDKNKGKGKKNPQSVKIKIKSKKTRKRREKDSTLAIPLLSPVNTMLIKTENPDIEYEMSEQNQDDHSHERHQLPMQGYDKISQGGSIKDQCRSQGNVEAGIQGEITNNVMPASGNQVEMGDGTKHTELEKIKIKKSKKVISSQNTKRQKSVSPKKKKTNQPQLANSSNVLNHPSDGVDTILPLSKLVVVVPKLKYPSKMNGHSTKLRKSLDKPEEPTAIVEVEDVVDSPVQVTWKKVGGHKESRIFKKYLHDNLVKESKCMMTKSHGQNTSLQSLSLGISELNSSECETNGREHILDLNASPLNLDNELSHVANMKGSVYNDESACSTQNANSFIDHSNGPSQNTLSFPTEVNNSLPNPTNSTMKSSVKVMSLKDFEDEYRKRPRVVANISLNHSRMKPVVQLDDILKKRKGSLMNGTCKKKRLLMKFDTKDIQENERIPSDGNDESITNEGNVSYNTEMVGTSDDFVSFEDDQFFNSNIMNKTETETPQNENLSQNVRNTAGKSFQKSETMTKRKYTKKTPRKNVTSNLNEDVYTQENGSSSIISVTGENDGSPSGVASADFNISNSVSLMPAVVDSDLHKNGKTGKTKTGNNFSFKSILSDKFPNQDGGTKSVHDGQSSKVVKKASGSKLVSKKKVAIRNKINVSSLFGNSLERKRSKIIDVKASSNMSLYKEHSRSEMKMSLKLCSPKSPNWRFKTINDLRNTQTKGGKDKRSNQTVKVKPLKTKVDKHPNLSVFTESKELSLSAIKKRIKLPGLTSLDMIERRLTVECVTLLPKILLKNMAISGHALSVNHEDNLWKTETDRDKNKDLSLALSLYKNCNRRDGDGHEIDSVDYTVVSNQYSNLESSQCSHEDLLKKEITCPSSSNSSVNNCHSHSNSDAMLENSMMTQGYEYDSVNAHASHVSTDCDTDMNVMGEDYISNSVGPVTEGGQSSSVCELDGDLTHHSALITSDDSKGPERIVCTEELIDDSGDKLTVVVQLEDAA